MGTEGRRSADHGAQISHRRYSTNLINSADEDHTAHRPECQCIGPNVEVDERFFANNTRVRLYKFNVRERQNHALDVFAVTAS